MIRTFKGFHIPPNRTVYTPGNIIVFDTETKPVIVGEEQHHYFDIAWAYYANRAKNGKTYHSEWKFFDDKFKLCEYIENKSYERRILHIFAHNIFFDLQVSGFFSYFTRKGWKLNFVYDSGLTYILVIHKGKSTIKCISTTNFFDAKLKEIGEMIDLPKLEVDFGNDSPEAIKIYCKRDVEILVKALDKYFFHIIKNDLGNFGMTKASQAMNAYRHRFMPVKITVHNEPDIKQLERAAYFGGRTEAYYIGEVKDDDFVTLDINSMYPFVMRNNKLPFRLVDYVESPGLIKTENALKKFAVVAEVDILTDDPAYAYKNDKKTIFPVGRFHAFLSTPGLKYALEHDHITDIKRIAIYEQDYLFTDYVDYFYSQKVKYGNENNKIYKQITKIFLNSLYGKFGQKKPIEEKKVNIDYDGYYREEILDAVTGLTEVTYQLFNMLITQFGFEENPKSFVAIATHVTEYARLLLWKIIKDTGRDKVLYCDTDSIKIRKDDIKYVKYPMDETRLGALKVEDEFHHLIIYGVKDYETENDIKIKGIPKNAEHIGTNMYKYDEFCRSKEHMEKRITDYFLVRPATKLLYRNYDKGIVTESGKVNPISLLLS